MSLDLELGFRKSEILKIIQQFDSSFSFDTKPPVIQALPKQYPLIYKNDYFDLAECESVITGLDPNDNWQCSERDQAYRLINSSLNNGLFELDKNGNYFISADNFREWLKSKDIFIEGFSDITVNKPADTVGQPTIIQKQPIDQTAQIETLTHQLEQANKRIKELEASQPTADPIEDNPLAVIMDNTKDNYAPDLVYAVNLWLDLYHNNPKHSDSHTNRANTWLKNNTGYQNVKRGDTAMDRIREIATPLKDFGGQRAKEPKK